MLGKERFGSNPSKGVVMESGIVGTSEEPTMPDSNPSKGVVMESGIVGSSEVPNLPSALTMSSTESVASALRGGYQQKCLNHSLRHRFVSVGFWGP